MGNEIIVQLFERDLKKLRDEIAAYPSEDSLWAPLPGTINTGGNLCQHLIGNQRTYVGLTLGNVGYVRNRDAEFAARYFTQNELVAEVENVSEIVIRSINTLSENQLKAEYPREVLDMFVSQSIELILTHLSTHLAYHLGQINYHRRWVSTLTTP